MSKRKNFFLAIGIIFVAGIVFLFLGYKKSSVEINGKKIKVEKATTAYELTKGLGDRDNLCDDCGMLFLFPHKQKLTFVMRGMKFDLDMVWIDGNKIVSVAKNVSYDFKGKISSEIEADKVLELNAGTLEKYGIKEGNIVKF